MGALGAEPLQSLYAAGELVKAVVPFVVSRPFLILPLLGLGLLAPGVVAEPGEPAVFVLHDVPDNGYTYVGNPNTFGYVILDAGRATMEHQDGKIVVTQNDVVLYETNVDSSHDYNGLNTFQIAFPMVGPYTVHAEVPLSGSVVLSDDFTGYVHPNPATTVATVDLETAVTGHAGKFTVRVLDAAGAIVPHSDAIVEVRRPVDEWLLFRTHLHTHEEPMSFAYTFPANGEYLIRAVGYNAYPSEEGPWFAPVATTSKLTVGAGDGVADADLKTATGTPPYKLLTTVDPQDKSSPFSRFTVSALVFDTKADDFVAHVNFEAAIVDATTGAVLYRSSSLHEYDGHYEATIHWPTPGAFKFIVNAVGKGWVQRAELPFTVSTATPAGAPALGALVVDAQGLDALKSGEPQTITFSATTPLGTPATHSEIDYQVVRTAWGAPILANKLHTHEDGRFTMQATFPEEGDYLFVLDPVTIHGEITPQYYYGQVGGSLVVPFHVAAGPALPNVAAPTVAPTLGAPKELPGFELALLAGAALVALARRRA